MHRLTTLPTAVALAKAVTLGVATAAAIASCAPSETGTLRAATDALGATAIRSID